MVLNHGSTWRGDYDQCVFQKDLPTYSMDSYKCVNAALALLGFWRIDDI